MKQSFGVFDILAVNSQNDMRRYNNSNLFKIIF